MSHIQRAQIYYDRQDTETLGWAFRYEQDGSEVSGALESDVRDDYILAAAQFLAEVDAPDVTVYVTESRRLLVRRSVDGIDWRWLP